MKYDFARIELLLTVIKKAAEAGGAASGMPFVKAAWAELDKIGVPAELPPAEPELDLEPVKAKRI